LESCLCHIVHGIVANKYYSSRLQTLQKEDKSYNTIENEVDATRNKKKKNTDFAATKLSAVSYLKDAPNRSFHFLGDDGRNDECHRTVIDTIYRKCRREFWRRDICHEGFYARFIVVWVGLRENQGAYPSFSSLPTGDTSAAEYLHELNGPW
jgi:hypothetical protein